MPLFRSGVFLVVNVVSTADYTFRLSYYGVIMFYLFRSGMFIAMNGRMLSNTNSRVLSNYCGVAVQFNPSRE